MKLTARFIVPVDAPVIRNGAVLVEGGLIREIGRANDVRSETTIDYGDTVICPGLVNAHTHLELSFLAGQVPVSTSFTDWLHRLRNAARPDVNKVDRVRQSTELGIIHLIDGGATTVGDITNHPAWSREVLALSPLRAVSFGEVIAIGTIRHQLDERLKVAASTEHQTRFSRAGISPHAPYTVEPDGLRACADRADALAAPLCIHLAETADEDSFTRSREGPLADFLKEVGVWDDQIPVSGCGPVELAVACGVLGSRTLLAHANYVTDADIDRIARGGASVAFCPRTHAAFGHTAHRFRDMQAAGVNVCIGTDSLASNPSLSMLDELRFLRQHHSDVSSDALLEMATLCGARALGFADATGSIAVGKSADLVVLRSDETSSNDRWDQFLEATAGPLEVYIAGVPQLSGREALRGESSGPHE